MSMTVSIRIKRLTASKVAGQNRHDLRQAIPKYVDQERTAANDIIIEPANPTTLRQTCADRRAQRHCQRVLKSDAAIAMGGIITFGTEAQGIIQSLSKSEQRDVYLSVAQQLAKRLNTTLTGLVVHNDEAAPHAHFQLPGYDLSGVPLSKTVTREVTSQLQDIAGQVLAEQGLNITRGKPKAQRIEDGESRAQVIHRSVAELHRDLPKELEAARQKLEKNRALIDKAKQDLEAETQGREEKIQKRLEAYERRAAVAKADAERLEALLPADASQPVPVVTITTADLKDWQPKKAGWFREETETAAAERATQSPTIRAANRLISDQQRALGFAGNKTARERSDREAAERQRDDLARKYEKGLSEQQRQRLQQLADQTRQDNTRRRDERMKQERSKDKDKDKGLKR